MAMLRYFIFSFFISTYSFGQYSCIENATNLSPKRLYSVNAGLGGAWVISAIGLQNIWYKNVEKSSFHTFNDCNNWVQMDKVGHAYTCNKLSEFSGELYKWSGINQRKAALLGTGIGLGYQTTLELFDAYSSAWGFSWCDMGANIIGAGIYLSQALTFKEQQFIMKFSYHPTQYAQLRPEVLGSNFQESLLKDYNGQTYWISFHPNFSSNSTFIPKWLCISFGYSIDEKLVGNSEQITFKDKTYQSKREFLCSIDIDFSRLPVKKPWLKVLVKQLNYLKIPFPALILRNGVLIGSPIYF
jgi:hypothetical protein